MRFSPRYLEVRNLAVAGLHRPTGIRRWAVEVDVIEVIEIVGVLSRQDFADLVKRSPDPNIGIQIVLSDPSGSSKTAAA
jgi:hypothetical protein